MSDPKPSTSDILAKIRAKAAGCDAPVPAAPQSAEPAAEHQSASGTQSQSADGTPVAPKSTKDILAAARASAASGANAAGAGVADKLAAIRQQGAGLQSQSSAEPTSVPRGAGDIMAAIRAKAGAAVSSKVPDAGSSASAPPVALKESIPVVGLSAAEMIRAARSGAEAAGSKIALPQKPLATRSEATVRPAAPGEVPRRSMIARTIAALLSPIVVAWTSFVASLIASGLATARFMMPNVLVEPPTRFKIGPPNDYAPGSVSTKWQAQFNIWVVNAEVDGAQIIYALSTVCTHLGCTPNWLEGEQKFKCPCHGSGFYKTGVNFEGPAPRPLERVGIRLAEDGMLEVDKSVKFQKELGQWMNAASFVGIS